MKTLRIGLFFAVVVLACGKSSLALAVWQEPTCDPTNTAAGGPSAAGCNISAPLNVSTAGQTKEGSITVKTGFAMGDQAESSTSGSFTLEAPENIFVDPMVSDILTASIFKRGTGTTDKVDLNSTDEVNGQLPSGSIVDAWVNTSGDTMTAALSTTAPALPYLLTVNPTALPVNTNGINITLPTTATSANSAGNGINMTGAVTGSLIYLNTKNNTAFTGEGPALNIKVETDNALNGKGILVQSYTKSASAYPVDVVLDTTATAERAISVTNNATAASGNMFGIYASSTVAAGKGVGVFGGAGGNTASITNATNTPVGIYGYSAIGTNGIGTYGQAIGTSGIGVKGYASGSTSYGGSFQGTSLGVVGSDSTLTLSMLPTQVGVYGQGTNYGGYFSGGTGVVGVGLAEYGIGVSASTSQFYGKAISASNTGGGDAIYATSPTGRAGYFSGSSGIFVVASDRGGYFSGSSGVYAIASSSIGVVGITSAASVGVVGKSTATGLTAEQNTIGVSGETSTVNQPNYYGGYFSGGTGIWAKGDAGNGLTVESVNGIGVSAKGKIYGGQFDGIVSGNQFLSTNMLYSPLDRTFTTGYFGYEGDDYTGYRNMVFDGAEVWLLAASGTNATVYRYSPTDFQIYKKNTFTSVGTSVTNLTVKDQSAIFYSSDGSTVKENIFPKDVGVAPTTNAVTCDSPCSLTTETVTSAAYQGGNNHVILGTAQGNIYDTYTGSLTRFTTSVSNLGGSIIQLMMDDAPYYLYALVDVSSGADKLVQIRGFDPDAGVVQTVTLPSTDSKTVKSMTYDGYFVWVTLQGATTDSIVKVDAKNNTYEEFDLSSSYCIDPNGTTFDGQYVWVACEGSSYFIRINLVNGRTVHMNGFAAFNISQSARGPIMFDGTYVWMVASDYISIRKYFSGHGDGSYGQPFAYRGLNVTDQNGAVFCLKVADSGSSPRSVIAFSGVCRTPEYN